jgi:integrase
MTTNNFRRALATQLNGSNVGHVTPHAFRRTVATTIDRAIGIQLAAELLGHTNTEITRIHYIEPNLRVDPTTADILEAALGMTRPLDGGVDAGGSGPKRCESA